MAAGPYTIPLTVAFSNLDLDVVAVGRINTGDQDVGNGGDGVSIGNLLFDDDYAVVAPTNFSSGGNAYANTGTQGALAADQTGGHAGAATQVTLAEIHQGGTQIGGIGGHGGDGNVALGGNVYFDLSDVAL